MDLGPVFSGKMALLVSLQTIDCLAATAVAMTWVGLKDRNMVS